MVVTPRKRWSCNSSCAVALGGPVWRAVQAITEDTIWRTSRCATVQTAVSCIASPFMGSIRTRRTLRSADPSYVAIKGRIFDVTQDSRFASGGELRAMVGKDSSLGFATRRYTNRTSGFPHLCSPIVCCLLLWLCAASCRLCARLVCAGPIDALSEIEWKVAPTSRRWSCCTILLRHNANARSAGGAIWHSIAGALPLGRRARRDLCRSRVCASAANLSLARNMWMQGYGSAKSVSPCRCGLRRDRRARRQAPTACSQSPTLWRIAAEESDCWACR